MAGYKVDRMLGEGSFGKVYQICRDEFGYQYKSALKIISVPNNVSEVRMMLDDGLDEEEIKEYLKKTVDMLISKIQSIYQLKGNKNVVDYQDCRVVPSENSIGWDIYIRMELLTPFFEYYRTVENQYSNRDVALLGIDICKALEACRKYDIMHGDIHTGNIFMSDDGNYKLGDFGIVRQMEKAMYSRFLKGASYYMAPEVYKGEDYDQTADREMALVRRLKGDALPKPVRAEDDFGDIILKACAYNPEDRYQNAVKMRQAIEEALGKWNIF